MKIEKIKQNNSNKTIINASKIQRVKLSEEAADTVALSSKPSFTGAEKAVKDLFEYLPAKKTIAFLDKHLEPLRGELGTIAITAFGTGAVAPMFIAFNPFVKAPKDATPEQKQEVKNNKAYTAMRQPISAVLAAIFQIGALKPIDKYLDKKFNEADKAKSISVDLDQSLVNNKSYLKTQITKEMKEEIKKGKATYDSDKKFKAELDNRIEARAKEQVDKVAKQLEETGKINVNGRELSKKSLSEIINSNIDNYINSVKGHMIDEKGLEFYTQRGGDLIENEKYFKDVLSIDKLPKDNLKGYIENLRKDAPTEGVEKILKEIAESSPELMESRCQRTLERIEKIKNICDGNFSREVYRGHMEADNKLIKELAEKLNNIKIKDAEKMDVKASLKELAELCTYNKSNKKMHNLFHDTETIQTDLQNMSKKVFKDVANSYKTFLEHGYKGVNTMLKMLIGIFITLPITCTALNWVYPRFMEIAFPKLAGIKKEGGNK